MEEHQEESSPKISLGKFLFDATSMTVAGKPPLEDWAGPLQFALWCQRASPWWIGDLLNCGDAHFGEAFSQVCEGSVSGDQLQRYESVARRVPPQNRHPDLSWSAHAAVARLSDKDQREMLRRATKLGWTSEQLRVQVRRFLEEKRS
ncbi:MAG: hypothetical protein QGF59_19320 [Pirellulaceae bacterium]|jgi:hypothetical protein|nr:hypothetical protein [Pirellulaceae bacterium]MDP6720824.1 hypothetical protein [Pirellulaceae bacterium]